MDTKLPPSEFEGTGPERVGVYNHGHILEAWEKLRIAYRGGQNADQGAIDFDKDDDWGSGGVTDPKQVI